MMQCKKSYLLFSVLDGFFLFFLSNLSVNFVHTTMCAAFLLQLSLSPPIVVSHFYYFLHFFNMLLVLRLFWGIMLLPEIYAQTGVGANIEVMRRLDTVEVTNIVTGFLVC